MRQFDSVNKVSFSIFVEKIQESGIAEVFVIMSNRGRSESKH